MMRRRSLLRTTLALAPLALAACEQSLDGLYPSQPGDGPVITFDLLARPLPEIPFPNDMASRLDPDSATGRRINASLSAPTRVEENTRAEFSFLDGWGTFAPMTVSFESPIDPMAVRARHLDDGHDDDAVYLVRLTAPAGQEDRIGELVPLDLGRGNFPVTNDSDDAYFEGDLRYGSSTLLFETFDEDTNKNGVLDPGEDSNGDGILGVPNTIDPTKPWVFEPAERSPAGQEGNHQWRDLLHFYERATNTLMIRPVIPMEQATTYGVVLTRRITSPDGKPIRSPFDVVNHVAQTGQLAPLKKLVDAGKVPGLTADDIAFAWAFTTQSVTTDLEAVREGLYGRGTLGWLSERFPAKLEQVQTIERAGAEPETDHPVYPLVSREKAVADNAGNRYILRGQAILDFLDKYGSQLGFAQGGDIQALIAAYSFVDYLVIGAFRSPDFMDDPRRPATDAIWRVDPVEGSAHVYSRPDDWLQREYDALEAGLSFASDADAKQRAMRFATRDRIVFFLVVPKAINGFKAPFPVALHAHGANSAREEALAFGGHLAKFGIATCAINGYAHGLPLDASLKQLVSGFLGAEGLGPFGSAVTTGRARDLDFDGTEDSGGDFWVADTFHARDAVRQTIVDYMQMVRVFRAFGSYEMGDLDGDGKQEKAGDFNADGTVDVAGPPVLENGEPSPGRDFFMQGISLGGITTSVATAVEPEIVAGAAVSAGGGLGDIAQRTDLGQVTNNVFPEVFGATIITRPSGDGIDLYTLTGGNTKSDLLKLNDTPIKAAPGDRLVLENLTVENDEPQVDEMVLPANRKTRLQVGSDTWSWMDDTPYAPGAVRPGACEDPAVLAAETERLKIEKPADCLKLTVHHADGSSTVIDTFPADVTFRKRTYEKGTKLIALQRGFGFKRNTKTFRRFLTLAQTILEPADPINYAPHYERAPLAARAGKPVGMLIIPTLGDMGVPINAGLAHARSAGLLPYVYDSAKHAQWGMSPNDVAIKSKALEAMEALEYYRPVAAKLRDPSLTFTGEDADIVDLVTCKSPEVCEKAAIVDIFNAACTDPVTCLDDNTPYMRGFGGAPRLKHPLVGDAVTKTYPSKDNAGKEITVQSRLYGIYPDVRGRHVFDFPNPEYDFDVGLYVVNLIGAYFSTRGSLVHTERCLHRDGYTPLRTAPDAQRDPVCGDIIPPYPVAATP